MNLFFYKHDVFRKIPNFLIIFLVNQTQSSGLPMSTLNGEHEIVYRGIYLWLRTYFNH